MLEYIRIDKTLPKLVHHEHDNVSSCPHTQDIGIDLYVRESTKVPVNGHALVPLNTIATCTTDNCFMALLPRSSTFGKTGLLLANSMGIIDKDYCGPKDELKALVYNTTDELVHVHRGARLFQLVLLHYELPYATEVPKIAQHSRGGFGSTD